LAGHEGCLGEKKYLYDFVGEAERERPLGRPRSKWENNFNWVLENMMWW
jgi:hypothetical protein